MATDSVTSSITAGQVETTDSIAMPRPSWMAKPALRPIQSVGEGWLVRLLPKNKQWGVLILVLVFLDALMILGSFWMAAVLRFDSSLLVYNAPFDAVAYRILALVCMPLWLIMFAAIGLYNHDNLLGGLTEYRQVIRACTTGTIIVILVSFMWREDFQMVSRGWLLFSWLFSCLLVGTERFAVRHTGYLVRRWGWFTDKVLVVGANEQGIAMAVQWSQSSTSGMKIVGFLDDFKPLGTPIVGGLQVVGRPRQLKAQARKHGATEIVLVSNAVAWETFEEIIASANDSDPYTLRLSPGFYEIMASGVAVTNKTFVPLFTMQNDRLVGAEAFMKSAFDISVGAILTVLSLPLIFLIAVSLKLSQKDRPVLIHHHTIGRSGQIFDMLKFRSASDMEQTHSGQKAPPIGPQPSPSRLEQWLYRSELDKLPQLFNVMVGQMSLVGPRPQVVGNIDRDPRTVRYQQALKPGATGPWAVSSFWISDDEIRNDIHYVRNWTPWLDIQILFQTLVLTVSGSVRWTRQFTRVHN